MRAQTRVLLASGTLQTNDAPGKERSAQPENCDRIGYLVCVKKKIHEYSFCEPDSGGHSSGSTRTRLSFTEIDTFEPSGHTVRFAGSSICASISP
ncbi:MAG: hypothetical protein BWY39_00031 [Spirochaetes bacterium ADurb.Bin269]|nr:MAG: hypothetical protein BWY39_00031 [Spirochaetes bacterium ADurb.Bin269]